MPTITRLYAFGSNSSGQQGLGHFEDLSEPGQCIFLRPDGTKSTQIDGQIRKIVAGGNHTLVLTESGVLYAAGDNSDGRCQPSNPSDDNSVFVPVELPGLLGSVTDVAATWNTSFAVMDGKKVFGFGEGCGSHATNQTGEGGAVKTVLIVPTLIFDVASVSPEKDGLNIKSISASMGHVVVLLSNGAIHGWGSCGKGQLGGVPPQRRRIEAPIPIYVAFAVNRAVTGRDYTYVCSANGQSKLLGNLKPSGELDAFAGMPIGALVSGWNTLFNLHNGHLQGCGRGERGQLPPPGLPAILRHAAGSEHSLAQTAAGATIAWGWGEHGNCGAPLDHRGNVTDRYNTIDLPLKVGEKVIGVGAGCASSFVWTIEDT